MPPPKGDIWEQFTELHDAEGKLVEARCKHCTTSKYASPNATRLMRHITKCEKAPPTIKKHYEEQMLKKKGKQNLLDNDQEEDLVDTPAPTSLSSSAKRAPNNAAAPDSASLPVKRQKSMTSCLDMVTKEEKQKLDALFAKALLSKGLPFNVFEGEHMEAAFKALRPAYKLPSKKSFAGPLLVQEYTAVMKLVNEEILKARSLTVELDGWSNNRNEGIVNFVVCTPKPFFYKAIEPGIQREDAEYLSDHILNVVAAVNAHKVLLLVTDNAASMKRAWALVQRVHPHIYAIGCGSHGLNLLFKDIVKLRVFKELISDAKAVVKIRKRRQLNAIFKSKQKQHYGQNAASLVLPSPTRFGGAYFMLVSLQKNKVALGETVLTEEVDVPPEVRKNVLDNEGFWSVLSFFVKFVKPVVEGTHLIEADDARLSHMVKICMNIKSLANEAFSEESVIPLGAITKIKNAVTNRISKFCICDIHLATYLIDPCFVGEGLTDLDCHRAMEVIEGMARHLALDVDAVIDNLADFKTKTNFYSYDKMWKRSLTMNSITWWDFFCGNQPLHPIAVRLLRLMPSACPCERVWSEYGFVHNKVRNRLGNLKVEKEVAVKHNLNLCQPLSEEKRKKNSELSAAREEKIRAYPSVSLFDNEGDDEDDWSDDEDDQGGPLWTSDEDLEDSSDEDENNNHSDAEVL